MKFKVGDKLLNTTISNSLIIYVIEIGNDYYLLEWGKTHKTVRKYPKTKIERKCRLITPLEELL